METRPYGKLQCQTCKKVVRGLLDKEYHCSKRETIMEPMPECSVGTCHNPAQPGKSCAGCDAKVESFLKKDGCGKG